ncbi:hypothetical protein [Stutzerimonas stutzeri]|uniref:hypothetical protein n=1 Tax=Stutzerimonas stutzeri TaxID=316 RepID=UPI0015E3B097|nr:hypothetical protein [Stutzerimonas stutzeri]MBA1280254.1 hypothetical protein [Stutzerimonas stutzeri]
MTTKPTQQVYEELQKAYEFFNQELFEGRLPSCVITLQRQHDTFGYFSANQFQSRVGGIQAHEIALNPSYFAVRTIHETLSVLVREMVSLDQTLHTKRDKLPRRRYRNTEWADMCEQIGLMPTSTGLPGGRRVGDNVQTYVIEGGPFDNACSRLVDEAFTLSWVDRFPPKLPAEAAYRQVENEEVPRAESMATFSLADEDDDQSDYGAYAQLASAPAEQPIADFESVDGDDAVAALSTPSPLADDFGDVPLASALPTEKKPAPPPMKRYEPVPVESLQEQGIEPREQVKNTSKTTFQCPNCGAKAWGKPSLRVGCYGSLDNEHDPLLMGAVAPKSA